MILPFPSIAAGHDNTNDLTPLHLIQYPYFDKYRKYLPVEWKDYDSRELNGARLNVTIGLPSTFWLTALLKQEEMDIMTTYCPGESALVTIRTMNLRVADWRNYNAVMHWPNEEEKTYEGFWRDVRWSFTDLQEIVP